MHWIATVAGSARATAVDAALDLSDIEIVMAKEQAVGTSRRRSPEAADDVVFRNEALPIMTAVLP